MFLLLIEEVNEELTTISSAMKQYLRNNNNATGKDTQPSTLY
jgi:hypothetical protein